VPSLARPPSSICFPPFRTSRRNRHHSESCYGGSAAWSNPAVHDRNSWSPRLLWESGAQSRM